MARKTDDEVIDWEGPGLRKAGHVVPAEFQTEEYIEEWGRCKDDPIYFIEKYWKISHPDPSKGLIPFKLRPFQKLTIQTYVKERKIAMLCSRQVGKTTVTVAFVGWFLIFHNNVSVGILAHLQDLAIEINERLKLGYEHVPQWMKHGSKKWNIKSLKLENNSWAQVSATTVNAGRGKSFSIVFLDEFAAVEAKVAAKLKKSLFPSLEGGTETKLFILSTPQGKNHFYQIVKEAEKGENNWKLIKADYRSDPDRDNPEWVAGQIKALTMEGFRQEHLCEFVGSTMTLIHPDILKTLSALQIITETPLRIYKQAAEGIQYAIFVDVSEGVGQDRSSVQVIDITRDKYEQVASYHDDTIKHHELALLIKKVAELYNDAFVFIEDASDGPLVAEALFDTGYRNMLSVQKMKNKDQYHVIIGRNKKSRFGGKTTLQTKLHGCIELKRLIENRLLKINDQATIEELESFVRDGPVYAAEDGNHDDLVTPFMLFGWLHTMREFKNMLQMVTVEKEEVEAKADIYSIINKINKPPGPEQFTSGGALWTRVG